MGLCLHDLFHYHEMDVAVRNERLREQLHLLVAAAMVGAGEGSAAQSLDKALAPAGPVHARVEAPKEAPRPPTKADLEFAEATKAEAMRMWG